MRNIKLLIAYDGTAYAGWQRQAALPTVQGTVEAAISRQTKAPVTLYGAGRTDAGVHALGMTANFHTPSAIPCLGFTRGLNSLLPADIRILAAAEVAPSFNARFDAISKIYAYHGLTVPVPLPHQRLYHAQVPGPLDLAAMAAALRLLEGEHDFASFEAAGSRTPDLGHGRGSVRRIISAGLAPTTEGGFVIRLHGDGFLRHMVRNIVGTVIEVGRGRRDLDDVNATLMAKNRSRAGATAPACGLFLEEVRYVRGDDL